MYLLPVQKEIDRLKTELISLQASYNEALRSDKPFYQTRKIYDAIREVEKQLERVSTAVIKNNQNARAKSLRRSG